VLDVLSQVLCWIKQFGAMVADALVRVVDLLIVSIAGLITGLIALLPSMPSFPTFAGSNWLTFFVPVSTLAGLAATLLGLYVAFFGAKLLLKFVQAL